MATVPRQLRLLRIDDDIHGGLPDPDDLPLQHIDQRAPAHLETVFVDYGGTKCAGIKNRATAIRFWNGFTPATRVDLIVSDVKFLDDTSPLNELAEVGALLALPTGLSHFKPFAAIARMSGAPLGVAIHTKEPTIWNERATSEGREEAVRAMSLLAAHEIGELAAILKQGEDLADAGLEACWAWLAQITATSTNFRGAIKIALPDYRRQLKEAHMLPRDWRTLFAWCEHMSAEANEADPPGVILSAEKDPGLRIMTEESEVDSISIRSLFADVPLTRTEFDFGLSRLPARCFSLDRSETFDELDADGYPRIGALVLECGDLSREYDKALEVLEHFPIPPNPPIMASLTSMKKTASWSTLAVGFGILFQDIRCHCWLFEQWKDAYVSQEYDVENDIIKGTRASDSESLASVLARLSRKFCDERFITLDDVIEYICVFESREIGNFNSSGAKRCVELLVGAGVLEYDNSTCSYRWRIGTRLPKSYIPEIPDRPPVGFLNNSLFVPAFSTDGKVLNDPSTILKSVFGLVNLADPIEQRIPTAALSRLITYAFDLPNAPSGTAFLERFRTGEGPRWLKTLCREFARNELLWEEEYAWPLSIRQRD